MVETDVEHRAGEADPQGHTRCAGCGYRWPCPDERSKPRELDPVDVAVLSQLGLGWTVEAKGRIVGTVVDFTDDDDGQRTYTLVHWHYGRRPALRQLTVPDVEPIGCHLPNSAFMHAHAQRIARYVSDQSSAGDPVDEARWLRIAIRLLEGCS